MEATFTPGPWEYRYNPTTDSHYVGQGLCCIVSEVYATEETVDRGFHEREANARLIAAAPEMLEALKRVDENWTSNFSGPDNPVALNRFSDTTITIWRSIRDAIAKAEGRT